MDYIYLGLPPGNGHLLFNLILLDMTRFPKDFVPIYLSSFPQSHHLSHQAHTRAF